MLTYDTCYIVIKLRMTTSDMSSVEEGQKCQCQIVLYINSNSDAKSQVIVEEPQIPIKSYKSEKKSKKQQNKIKQEYTDRDDHTAMKIHLDRLKVSHFC